MLATTGSHRGSRGGTSSVWVDFAAGLGSAPPFSSGAVTAVRAGSVCVSSVGLSSVRLRLSGWRLRGQSPPRSDSVPAGVGGVSSVARTSSCPSAPFRCSRAVASNCLARSSRWRSESSCAADGGDGRTGVPRTGVPSLRESGRSAPMPSFGRVDSGRSPIVDRGALPRRCSFSGRHEWQRRSGEVWSYHRELAARPARAGTYRDRGLRSDGGCRETAPRHWLTPRSLPVAGYEPLPGTPSAVLSPTVRNTPSRGQSAVTPSGCCRAVADYADQLPLVPVAPTTWPPRPHW